MNSAKELGNFDKKFEKRLPMRDERFFEGSYELDINKLGYEKYHMRFDVAMGEFPEYDVDLKPKRPGKAFFRSFLIPGRGQIYSSDADNRGRLVMGLTYFVSTMACVGVSGYLWNDFSKAKDTYEVAKRYGAHHVVKHKRNKGYSIELIENIKQAFISLLKIYDI